MLKDQTRKNIKVSENSGSYFKTERMNIGIKEKEMMGLLRSYVRPYVINKDWVQFEEGFLLLPLEIITKVGITLSLDLESIFYYWKKDKCMTPDYIKDTKKRWLRVNTELEDFKIVKLPGLIERTLIYKIREQQVKK